jgi:hypothetical protein
MEFALQQELSVELWQRGFRISPEQRLFHGGRLDLAVMLPGSLRAFALIEIKVAEPMCGIGQLFAYRAGLKGDPHLVLVIDSAAYHPMVGWACKEASVECWTAHGELLSPVFRHVTGPKNLWNKYSSEESLENP